MPVVRAESAARTDPAVNIVPSVPAEPAAHDPASGQAERFPEALLPMLEHAPKNRGKRLSAKEPEPFDGAFTAFCQWCGGLQDYKEINSPSLPTDK